MKIKNFLENNKGKKFIIQTQEGVIKKITIEKMKYEIKEDELYIFNTTNRDFVVLNLNIIRNINKKKKEILIFLEDKSETKIKISVM